MAYTITIPDNFFTVEEQAKLYTLFGSTDPISFEQSLSKICKAALTEYKEMLLGKGLPTRADEIKQHRLLHLISYFFQNSLPNEAEVSMMFQLTESYIEGNSTTSYPYPRSIRVPCHNTV